MTLDEFFDELRKTPRDWYLEGDRIRRRGQTDAVAQCPITSLCSEIYEPHQFGIVAASIKLDHWLACRIASAADEAVRLTPEAAKIRPLLLAACGLENPEQVTENQGDTNAI